MIYKAYSSDSNHLLSLPETGMGYQIIEGQLIGSYSTKRYVVYNSDLIVDLDNNFLTHKQRIINLGYSTILNESNRLDIRTDSIKLIPRSSLYESKFLAESEKLSMKRHSGGNGAIDNPRETANGVEIFVRISAYENDKRINFVENKLINGTYTITHNDYIDCMYANDDPIDRYALPNDEKIKWAFYIRPQSIDILQRGIVQPAFGHNGGGIEAYFENGTSKNTYYNKKEYGK